MLASMSDNTTRGDSGNPQALRQLQRLLQESPDDPQLWVRVGNISRKYGRLDRAVQAYAKAIDLFASRGQLEIAFAVARKIAALAVGPGDDTLAVEVEAPAPRAPTRARPRLFAVEAPRRAVLNAEGELELISIAESI